MKKSKKKVKKRKIRYGRVFLTLLVISLFFYLVSCLINFPIKNIYIYNNNTLTDQEIIDLAGIRDYPSIFSISSYKIKKKLKKNIYIEDVEIRKIDFKEVHIWIEENYALFYNSEKGKTILKNKKETKDKINCPVLVNHITDKLYDEFVSKISQIDREVIDRISEIKYDPNNVDEERFLITMNDGNYVYLTLMYFDKINNYVDIIKNFENQKGILYLDSGEYFKVFE